jgi:dihydrofolate reductase
MLLQMMMTLDGMVSGPKGELDWMSIDEPIERDHLARLKQAELLILGAGVIPEMSSFWMAAEKGEKEGEVTREMGRAMNAARKVVYSHRDQKLGWRNVELHVAKDDYALIEDVKRLKHETKGPIVTYGGVRMARSLLQHGLIDEIHLDICPIVLADGQPLFTGTSQRSKLRLRDHATYPSGTTMVHYEVMQRADDSFAGPGRRSKRD